MDDKNRLNDGEKPQTPADREAKAKRRILVGIAAGALLVVGLITGGIYLSGRQGGTPTAPGSGTPTSQQEQVDGEKPCEHDWTVTYKTVHHDAVTHTENVPPVYEAKTSYHTVCNDCQQTIDGIADAHIKDTGHSGYSTNVPITGEVLVSEGFTREAPIPRPTMSPCRTSSSARSAARRNRRLPSSDPLLFKTRHPAIGVPGLSHGDDSKARNDG